MVCLLLFVAITPGVAKAGPVISNYKYGPKYPQLSDTINASADVTDPQGLSVVRLFYCDLPSGSCHFADMTSGPVPNYYYNLAVNPAFDGMDIYINVTNAVGDMTETPKYYIQYAKSINATMVTDATEVPPGGMFNLTVSAHYWNNTSAPVEYSQVNITRFGSSEYWLGMTDANGNCRIAIDAPLVVNSYMYNVSVTNRTMKGYANEVTILVLIEPMADLQVRAQDFQYSPQNPTEGDNVTADITIHNIGTENETFTAIVTLDTGGSKVELKNITLPLVKGTSTVVHVSWLAVAGPQWLNISLDPDNDADEINEQNNHASVLIDGAKKVNNESSPLFIYALVAIAAVVVIALVALMLRRRKPKAPVQ